MNMANNQYHDHEFDYQADHERRLEKDDKAPRQQRRTTYARANRPAVHNGIHRRRNKRFSW
jgi:hypothetical protein